jgi:2-dehydro-3-deoxyglucarate aldolase/4-hydroxy-2-oxoheptanedioate aldolase
LPLKPDRSAVDHEHGVIPPGEADNLAFACKRLGLTTFSRVATADRVDIQHALDSGVDGVILPQIANLAHAREATALAKYPPRGSRGVGYSRAMSYGGTGPGFFEAENRRTLCYAMIETPGALADVEAIARLDTVDGLFGQPIFPHLRGRSRRRRRIWLIRRVAPVAAACRKTWAAPRRAQGFAFACRRRGTGHRLR